MYYCPHLCWLQRAGLLGIAFVASACAPYRSGYYMQTGIAPFTRFDGSSRGMAGHFAVAPAEFGDVKGGVRPGWSVTVHPIDFDIGAHIEVPSKLPGEQRFLRLSAGGFGTRLYLLSHFVEGKTPNVLLIPIPGGYGTGPSVLATPQKQRRVLYQVAAAGVDMRFAPLALGVLGSREESKFYDGYGEVAVFANASIPFGYGASLEARGGVQHAVTSGSTAFFRLEIAFPGARSRKPTPEDTEPDESLDDDSKWSE